MTRPVKARDTRRPTMHHISKSPLRLACLLIVLIVTPLVHASKEHPVIGLSLDTFKEERWQRDRDTFVSEVQSMGGHVIVQSAEWDDALQATQIEAMIQRHVDVLVIVPHDATALGTSIKAANAANIPIISYDRLIMNADVGYYLSFDNVKVGETQAKYLVNKLPTNRTAHIIRLYGARTDNNAKMFKRGQDNVLEPLLKSGRIEVVAEGWADEWKAEAAQKITSDALQKPGVTIDGILASNDKLAGGAIDALTQRNLSAAQIIITGQDADLPACARIRTGTQSMTVYKPVKKLASLGAKIAVELARGNAPESTTTINNGLKEVPAIFQDIVAVDGENIVASVLADGFHRTR
jgi:D-xylose transport system substrate-binding protein